MKISLITMHRVLNYGSVLQTYALSHILIKKGYDVEILDYIPQRLKLWNAIILPLKKKNSLLKPFYFIYLVLVNVPKWRMYNSFLKSYVTLSPQKYNSINEVFKNLPVADVYMTGSDQVWNTTFDGFVDDSFFLAYAPLNKKKIAYAASFGREVLEPEELNIISPYLRSYNSISVREKSALSILKEIGNVNGVQVLDPTLLLDKEEWSKTFMQKDRLLKDKYLLVYFIRGNENQLLTIAKAIAQKKGLKIYLLHNGLKVINGCDKTFRNQCPEEYISLFLNADYIVASSFHGTAFAINFNKQFVSVLPSNFKTRVESILSLTGLTDRMIFDDFNIDKALAKIDFNNVNLVLEAERIKSYDFLENSLRKL
jgi:hypothetical protein